MRLAKNQLCHLTMKTSLNLIKKTCFACNVSCNIIVYSYLEILILTLLSPCLTFGYLMF